jgi:hypothetical protein
MINHARRVIETTEAQTRFQLDQAARESFRDDTAFAMWQLLFNEGQYRRARDWWFSEIEPATRQREP